MYTVQEPRFHTGWDQSGNSNKATGSMQRLFENMSLQPTTHSQPKDPSSKRNDFFGLLTRKVPHAPGHLPTYLFNDTLPRGEQKLPGHHLIQ